jgi:hypothetical protein
MDHRDDLATCRKSEYRALLERWWAIKKVELAADNIDVAVVRLAGEACTGSLSALPSATSPADIQEEEDMPANNKEGDVPLKNKKRKRRSDGDGEDDDDVDDGEMLVAEENKYLQLHAAYLGSRNGADGGEGDNVGVLLQLLFRIHWFPQRKSFYKRELHY